MTESKKASTSDKETTAKKSSSTTTKAKAANNSTVEGQVKDMEKRLTELEQEVASLRQSHTETVELLSEEGKEKIGQAQEWIKENPIPAAIIFALIVALIIA